MGTVGGPGPWGPGPWEPGPWGLDRGVTSTLPGGCSIFDGFPPLPMLSAVFHSPMVLACDGGVPLAAGCWCCWRYCWRRGVPLAGAAVFHSLMVLLSLG